jgi:hypothetical protein
MIVSAAMVNSFAGKRNRIQTWCYASLGIRLLWEKVIGAFHETRLSQQLSNVDTEPCLKSSKHSDVFQSDS